MIEHEYISCPTCSMVQSMRKITDDPIVIRKEEKDVDEITASVYYIYDDRHLYQCTNCKSVIIT